MISLIMKFVSWVKDMFSFIISIPSKIIEFCTFVGSALSFLPNGLGTIISGILLFAVSFVMIYAIVKLVSNLL